MSTDGCSMGFWAPPMGGTPQQDRAAIVHANVHLGELSRRTLLCTTLFSERFAALSGRLPC